MGVSSGRSRVGDLAFQVFGRTLHPDWFAVRAHKRLAHTGWEADVRIVEGGHAILWSSGTTRIAEVLSGPETALPEGGLLYHSSVRHERSTALRPNERAEYQTCFAVERIDSEVFAHLNDELSLDASQPSLFHQFAPANRLASSPLSRLYYEARPRGLSVQSFHTFPGDRAIVRVQSLFEIAGALPR